MHIDKLYVSTNTLRVQKTLFLLVKLPLKHFLYVSLASVSVPGFLHKGFIYQLITCPTMSGDYDQTDQVSHGCFLRHCSKGQHLPWARISGVYPIGRRPQFRLLAKYIHKTVCTDTDRARCDWLLLMIKY